MASATNISLNLLALKTMGAEQADRKTRDLIADQFPHDLSWEPAKRLDSLQRLFEFADTHCTRAIQWYNTNKRSKQRLGYSLRFLSIVAVAVAGIIPVMSENICRQNREECVSPAWSTVFIALAALFVALDRFAGYTSGWVRYVRSAQRLTEIQGQFRLDWCMYLHGEIEGNKARSEDDDDQESAYPSKDYGLRLCKEYINSVNSVVSRETNMWAQEFQQALVQFEKPTNQNHPPLKLNEADLSELGNGV